MTESKLVKILKSPRMIILMVSVAIAFFAIFGPPTNLDLFAEGIEVKSVERSSAADEAEMRPGERIISVDNNEVKSVQDFTELTSGRSAGEIVSIETDKRFYKLTVKPEMRNVTLPETEEGNGTEMDGTNQSTDENITENKTTGTENQTSRSTEPDAKNESINGTVSTNRTIEEVTGVENLGITVGKLSRTKIRTGLDLQGGTRVLLHTEEKLSDEDLEILIQNMKSRLNVFGLSDVTVRDASDISGQQRIMVEIANANEREVKDLVSKQGKFEAKVGNVTVIRGLDVDNVCRSADCSGIDYQGGGCQRDQTGGWFCPFFFSITLNTEAAERQADATRNLSVIDGYLSEKLFLYLDDELVDELNIAESLKGKPSTSIQISGSGYGPTENAASKDAISNMKKLQTILITGSLPVKLEIGETNFISPSLGEEFARNAVFTGIVAITAVMIMLLIAYRRITVAVPIMCISLIEIFLLLGVAALINWNIDLAAIAGIIAAVGMGVNDQIIITDEAMKGHARKLRSWSEKLKSAFSVIFGAYFTMLFAMIPLFVIGAGLLRGFAVTTIIGITVGVLITRPAYAKIMEILTED